MKSLKGSIAVICTIGIYAMATSAFALPASEPDNIKQNPDGDKGLTSVILSFFGADQKKKNVGPPAVLLKKPAKEKADQYITLSEPGTAQSRKKLSVTQSFAVKPSLIFNMGGGGLVTPVRPSGFSALGASTTGHQVTFSYGSEEALQNSDALGISIGSQFLMEPNSILSPLYDGSEFDQLNGRQVYNLSIGMGYAGFRLGASFSQEKMLYDSGLKGFDIGLGYSGNKWGADIKFGEYKRQRDLLFASTEEFFNTVYALEIGAAYHLHSNIRFTGRFTYYSYGQENDLDSLRNSQVFFLGTNVNF